MIFSRINFKLSIRVITFYVPRYRSNIKVKML